MTSWKGLKNHKKVIPSQQGNWTFYDYVQDKKNPIEAWYKKELSFEAQQVFDAVLKACSKTEDHNQWVGFRHFLTGSSRTVRIWELGFLADKRQYRILCIFGDQRKQAVILVGCYHKGRNYTPSNAIVTACKRAKDLKEGKGGLCERKIETDF